MSNVMCRGLRSHKRDMRGKYCTSCTRVNSWATHTNSCTRLIKTLS